MSSQQIVESDMLPTLLIIGGIGCFSIFGFGYFINATGIPQPMATTKRTA